MIGWIDNLHYQNKKYCDSDLTLLLNHLKGLNLKENQIQNITKLLNSLDCSFDDLQGGIIEEDKFSIVLARKMNAIVLILNNKEIL